MTVTVNSDYYSIYTDTLVILTHVPPHVRPKADTLTSRTDWVSTDLQGISFKNFIACEFFNEIVKLLIRNKTIP